MKLTESKNNWGLTERVADFGLVDDKGRAVGYRVAFGETPAHISEMYVKAQKYIVDRSTQRAGRDFGASQHFMFFSTLAEAEKYAMDTLKKMEKTNAKKWG